MDRSEQVITSQPVASERLLILMRGVLPMAATSPLLRLFSEAFLLEDFGRLLHLLVAIA